MFKSAMLGCGGRARGHADAYKFVKGGKLSAICDLSNDLLQKLGNDFGIEKRYSKYEEMLEKEKPDVLHIVTPPTLRHSLMKVAADHGVKAVIVEKPIAVQAEDYRDLLGLANSSQTKFIVNTQLNFHPRNLDLKKTVAEGKIGEIKFIEGSARMWPVEQAPHVLQLISSYINNSQPVKVFAQTAGKHYLTHKSPSPDNSTAAIWYKNGVRAHVNFGTASAPKVHESEHVHMHKRVAVYGSKGYIQWTMWNWERFTPEGGYESGKHDYGAEDVLAQAGLTDAVFDWIKDESKIHPTHLKQSLAEFNLLLGIYVSGLEHRVLDLPFDPPNKLLETLKNLPN